MKNKGFKRQLKVLMFLCLNLLSFCVSSYSYAENEPKNILIINSYHQGLEWTRDESDGIIDTLKKSDLNLTISVEFMDWKSHPGNENLQYLTSYFKYKYQDDPIDMLIVTDDAALVFALDHRESLFSNAPVVFCGVNQNSVTRIVDGHQNVTGVLEEIDPTDTLQMALEINPDLKDVYVLFDNSESGVSTGKLVMDTISANKDLSVHPLNDLTYDELIQNVKTYDKNSIILVTTYFSDVTGKILDFEFVSREVSKNSNVPVYHLYEMGLDNGAFGGHMISGRLQGENAASLALRILNGEDSTSISVVTPKATRYVLDYQQLRRFGISHNKINQRYEIINKPFSFFEEYKILAITVLASFTVLIAFIGALLFYIKKIHAMKKELSKNHEELTQIYEELAASDEELKQQFDEIYSVKDSLSKSEERFRIAADGSNAAIWDVEMSTMQYHFTDRFYELLGYEKDEINAEIGGWRTIIHPDDLSAADSARSAHLEGKTPYYNCEYRMRRKNGGYLWLNVRGKAHKDSNGNITRFAGSLIDITERKEYEKRLQDSYQELEATYEELTATQEELRQQYDEAIANQHKLKSTEERLAYLAYHDSLTGLPNKLSLYERAQRDILDSKEISALLFIDMDNFKYINDTMGHASGDQLISKASERLTSLLKDNCTLYRLSGDEFIIIIQNIKGINDAEIFASHVLAGFKDEFEVSSSLLHISLSMGIAIYPEHGRTIEELLKHADIAMYSAKAAGRNRYVIYDQLMNQAFTERANIEKYLHTALGKNEFEVYYQPQLDLKSSKISGFEALLRWKSPELGNVSPLKFIKVAEDTHLIIPLGTWVLRNACAFLKKLHQKGYGNLSVSVNISMLQLLQTDFPDMVITALEFFELKPEYLELEITETILMESFESIGKILENLSSHGVRIALDDFGKGYSSLSYLKHLPISTLKIDKSFIDNIANENEKLTRHIVSIGKSMGMCVIAEGVEKQEQLEYLTKYECHRIQGYLFSRPVPEDQAVKLLETIVK